jgi:hypothetical protein
MRAFAPFPLLAIFLVCACTLGDDDADADECAGAPFGSGYTLSPGPPIHDGYYTTLECADICGPGFDACAPVIEQRSQPRYRCGAPPPESCGPRHMPRPNVRGPCDVDGFDATFGADLDGRAVDCKIACGPFVPRCRLVETRADGQSTYRCGEERPEGCGQ